ncbi:hypothetical protein SADUNF_Sadunf08G0164700 [Salix dunnii]|uniref:Uncharacterized protein n=1 Tax=Salix dunnii TaxID=1413687 RepID=A0A835JXR4_9ROSI|nr:hypothetical protein SADUNF_Sadunf08G0164700 [Salix dunnii]
MDIKAGRVGVGEEDMSDGMQCADHPYRNNPGGICAFCLQEKLGKLVSSSFPLPVRGSSSSSSPSPSFRSDIGVGGSSNGGAGTSLSLAARPTTKKCRDDGGNNSHYQEYYTRVRIPFLMAKKKKTMVSSSDRDIVFKRSKSTATPRRSHFLSAATEDFSPRRRGLWSFLSLSSSKPSTSTRKIEKMSSLAVTIPAADGSTVRPKEKRLGSSLSKKGDNIVVVEEDDDDDDSLNSQATASATSFERKVSRSRSVGCGSRSFSGDFFERISTGFGDCTLRRVESQREGKPKVTVGTSHMKERVRCGGIFGGFIITSSSSSSSSSYWVSSSAEDMNGKSSGAGPLTHGRSRSRSWVWAFASPMKALGSKPFSKNGKREIKRSITPNLSAIPSLLAVRV